MSSFYGNIGIGEAGQYAQQASASAAAAQASAVSANASAIQAAQSAESVNASELTRKISSAFPTNSAGGEIVVFADGADGIPVKRLTLNLLPHQSGSGDPSLDNVRPISGYTVVKVTRTGKNVLPNQLQGATIGGNTYVKNADGSVMVSGTVENQSSVRQIINSLPIANGNYIVSGGTEHVRVRINKYDLNDELIGRINDSGSGTPFTVDDTIGRIYVGINPYPTGEIIDNVTVYPMIRAASFADDTYEPYTGEEYDITIPTAAGTVYGGSLEINDDGSGTLIVDTGYLAVTAASDFAEVGSFAEGTNGNRCGFRVKNNPFEKGADCYCNIAKTDASVNSGTASNWILGTCYLYNSHSSGWGGGSYFRYIFPTTVTSSTEALQYLIDNGCEFTYKLHDPQTYALTTEQITTLLGNNTIFMDANGTIDLQYRTDTQKYIDSRIALLNANLAFIEEGMTASRAYSIGQYVNVKGQLYKVTSAIASGATFTVDTNIVSTTVGAELTALN